MTAMPTRDEVIRNSIGNDTTMNSSMVTAIPLPMSMNVTQRQPTSIPETLLRTTKIAVTETTPSFLQCMFGTAMLIKLGVSKDRLYVEIPLN